MALEEESFIQRKKIAIDLREVEKKVTDGTRHKKMILGDGYLGTMSWPPHAREKQENRPEDTNWG